MFEKTNCVALTECIACGSDNLHGVLDLGYQPLANSYKNAEDAPEDTFPLAINVCHDCFHVQLTHMVNPDLLFKDYLYVSGTTNTMKEFFDWFATLSVEYARQGAKNVLDIGCNDGSQLTVYKARGYSTFGVDPAENLHDVSTAAGHNVVCGYFTGNEFDNTKFDIITCQNAFAHNFDQLSLLKNVKRVLADDGVFMATVSQANMIRNGEFDTIYHEHLSFYNINSVNELCKRAGLNLIDVRTHPIHGNSYVFVISKDRKNTSRIKKLLEEEMVLGLHDPKTYEIYANKCRAAANGFYEAIRAMRLEGVAIIGYGAPAKGNTLMNYTKVGPDRIIDDNPLKQGKYTPGLGILIEKSEDVMKDIENVDGVCFIPLAWNFYDEIKKKIKARRGDHKDFYVRYFPELVVANA